MSASIQIFTPSTTIRPGEIIQGELRLITTKPLDISTFHLQFFGKESCVWYEPAVRTWVGSKKVLCLQPIELIKKPSAYICPDQETTHNGFTPLLQCASHVEPGTHDFIFEFIVQNDLPPSFKGSAGSIEYKLQATVRTNGFLSFLFPIKQELVMELQSDSHLSSPMCIPSMSSTDLVTSSSSDFAGSLKNFDKTFWFGQGGMHIRGQLSKPQYAAGETIQGSLQLVSTSQTSKHPKKITISLVQTAYYSGNGLSQMSFKNKETTTLQKQIMETSSLEKSFQTFFQITMPSKVTPSFRSQHISLEYHIKVSVDYGIFSLATNLELPCTVVSAMCAHPVLPVMMPVYMMCQEYNNNFSTLHYRVRAV